MAIDPSHRSDSTSAPGDGERAGHEAMGHGSVPAGAPPHAQRGEPSAGSGPNGAHHPRKKKRRQRTQRGKRRNQEPSRAPRIDVVSRERIFQEIEGLLRRIREQAEETACWTDEQLRDFTQMVVNFTKTLEQEGDPISGRLQNDYQRLRDRLALALKA